MKVLVIGGMHGNEPLGQAIVELLKDRPIKNVAAVLANEEAVAANCRFVGQDLNRSFPGKDRAKDYEPRRAAQILKMTVGYDVVLDFHNTHCPNNDCGFVGETAGADLLKVASFLGLDKIIVADYDCINKYARNCLSVEVSLSSPLNKVELWYDRIQQLSSLESLNLKPRLEKYRFVYRMTLDDNKKLRLSEKKLVAFKKIDKSLASAMNVKSPAYPIFIGDKYTPYNYGGLLNKH